MLSVEGVSAHPPRAAVVAAAPVPAVPPPPPPPPLPPRPLLAAAVAAAVVADALADAPADDGSRAAETAVAEVLGGSGTGERKSSAADAVAAAGAESLEDRRARVGAAVAEYGTRFLVRPEVVAAAV